MLTVKQEKFIEEYIKSGNATSAYVSAYGGGSDSARAKSSVLLRKANVRARLEELQAEMASKAIATSQELQERLTAIVRGETTEEVILASGERIRKQVSIRDVLKAIELLLKVQGAFVVKQEVSVNSVPVVIGGAEYLED